MAIAAGGRPIKSEGRVETLGGFGSDKAYLLWCHETMSCNPSCPEAPSVEKQQSPSSNHAMPFQPHVWLTVSILHLKLPIAVRLEEGSGKHHEDWQQPQNSVNTACFMDKTQHRNAGLPLRNSPCQLEGGHDNHPARACYGHTRMHGPGQRMC